MSDPVSLTMPTQALYALPRLWPAGARGVQSDVRPGDEMENPMSLYVLANCELFDGGERHG